MSKLREEFFGKQGQKIKSFMKKKRIRLASKLFKTCIPEITGVKLQGTQESGAMDFM